MKKLFVLITVAIAAAFTTGCDIDADFHQPAVINNIRVFPEDWERVTSGPGNVVWFCDIELPEITDYIFTNRAFHTYWIYDEERDNRLVTVQEPLPATVHGDDYTETISCSYDVGYVRISISRAPFYDRRPDRELVFRTVINQ
ncbi:MAG: hypothetical protein LBU97_03815 [Alistipes sp.]|jgi:hypothetical protein|nr:hypothetical protein [Alistipes sp.]